MDNNVDSETDPSIDTIRNTSASTASIAHASMDPKMRNTGPSEDVLDQALTPEVLGHDIVKLFVGPKRKKFTVHKDLICARSDFFSKAFNDNFLEGKKNLMYLPEDDPGAFTDLIDYIYRQAIPGQRSRKQESYDGTTEEISSDDYEALLKRFFHLYFLAEKYCMWDLTNKVMSAIHASYSFDPMVEVSLTLAAAANEGIYKNTTDSSKLRNYCALIAAQLLHAVALMEHSCMSSVEAAQYFDHVRDLFSQELPFFADLFSMQIKYRKLFRKFQSLEYVDSAKFLRCMNICDFHVHRDGKHCKEVVNLKDNPFESESEAESDNNQ